MFIERLLVKMIAPRVHIKRTDEDTEFEWNTNTIYYNPAEDPQDAGFARHIEQKHLFPNPKQYSMHLWTLLHELGHYFNPDEAVDIESKAICAILPREMAEECERIQNMYYDSPDEFAATEWACSWVEHHRLLARFFTALLR